MIRMSSIKQTVILLLFSVLILSCNRQRPQLPSNKGNDTDSNAVSLLTINQNLAKKEDAYLKKVALQNDKAFKRSEIGFWYKIDPSGRGDVIKDSMGCKISCQVSTLKGKILKDDIKQLVIGKKQVVTGLEEGLKLCKRGDNAIFIIPWYLAYGMKGNEPLIHPYTSLIYKVKVFN